MTLPKIIQGGMGAAVSDFNLASAVAKTGNLGVVSGTALDVIMFRRLELDHFKESVISAIENFPVKRVADRILESVQKGSESISQHFKIHKINSPFEVFENIALASFVEVFLAKKGHEGPVGINLLEKIQIPNISSIYGAMLAGVDYITMGAGIPKNIPGVLDKFAKGDAASVRAIVTGQQEGDKHEIHFDPAQLFDGKAPELKRPNFLAIVSSNILATTMVKKSSGKVDGLILENHLAGGHNAPTREKNAFLENGEPAYGAKDEVNLEKIKKLDVPFWIAGDYCTPEKVKEAENEGAAGVQVGTLFAFCKESGLDENIRIKALQSDELEVFTDPKASPTGFPFKVLQMAETLSEKIEYEARKRICNLGYLRELFRKSETEVAYRCPAEPAKAFLAKGGEESELEGRKCLCNGLMANIGLGFEFNGLKEKPLVTAGKCINYIKKMFDHYGIDYKASDVIDYLLNKKK